MVDLWSRGHAIPTLKRGFAIVDFLRVKGLKFLLQRLEGGVDHEAPATDGVKGAVRSKT